MKRKFNYVYVTSNTLNGKQYVGDHSTDNLKDDYLGSGVFFIKAIKKYGRENFKREILEKFDTKQEAFDSQEKYIQLFNTLNPNGYNLSPKGGNRVKGCHSEESKRKIGKSNSIALTGKKLPPFSQEHKNKIGKANSISLKGHKPSEETIEKRRQKMIGKLSPMKGRKQSKESIEKRAKSNTGKKRTPEQKERMKAAQQNRKELTPEQKKHYGDSKRGKKLTEEHCDNISKSLKGKPTWNKGKRGCFSEETLKKRNDKLRGQKRTQETKNKMSTSAKGKPKSPEHRKKCGLANLGKKSPKIYCEHCKKEYANYMYKLYHGDNCKLKNI